MRVFSRDMTRSLCPLLIYVNQALVTNLDIANKSFNTIRENKILTKISEFTYVEERADNKWRD